MKGCPNAIDTGKGAALPEARDDPVASRQFVQVVSRFGMGFDGQNLAVDPKGADAVGGAKLQRPVEGIGIVPTDGGQMLCPVGPGKRQHVSGSGPPELDGFLSKNTAESQTNHGITVNVAGNGRVQTFPK